MNGNVRMRGVDVFEWFEYLLLWLIFGMEDLVGRGLRRKLIILFSFAEVEN